MTGGHQPFDLGALARSDDLVEALSQRRAVTADDPAVRLLAALAADVDASTAPATRTVPAPCAASRTRRRGARVIVAFGVASIALTTVGAVGTDPPVGQGAFSMDPSLGQSAVSADSSAGQGAVRADSSLGQSALRADSSAGQGAVGADSSAGQEVVGTDPGAGGRHASDRSKVASRRGAQPVWPSSLSMTPST